MTCTLQDLPRDATYSLTPSAEGANFFMGWEPSECDSVDFTAGVCNVILTSDRTVTARFESEQG